MSQFIIIGDRVLLKPKKAVQKTKSGLYLPPGVQEKEKIQSGFVVQVGPGFPIGVASSETEHWQGDNTPIDYLPLQISVGDEVIYLQSQSYEIEYESEKYIIVSQSAILMALRD